MIQSLEFTGKNIDDAIEKALKNLGMERDDVSVEVLQRQKSGFLGIGAVEARIRVSYEDGKPEPAPEAAPAQKTTTKPIFKVSKEKLEQIAESERPARSAASGSAASETVVKNPTTGQAPRLYEKIPAAKTEGSAPAAKPARPRPERRDRRENDRPRVKAPAEPFVKKPVSDEEPIPFISGLLDRMHIEHNAEISDRNENAVTVSLSGPNMGKLIGRHGETMDAIQYISSLAYNHGKDKHVRVIIDTENYREKREQTLAHLAQRMSELALKQNRPITLEPMSPTERRMIHTALQGNEKLTTYSVGADPMRRVVISPVGCDPITAPTGHTGGRGHGHRGGRNRRYNNSRSRSAQTSESSAPSESQE